MCVLSIKVPIQKKAGNLFNEPCRLLFLCFFMRKWLVSRVHIQEAKKILKNNFKCIYSIMKYFNRKIVNKCMSLHVCHWLPSKLELCHSFWNQETLYSGLWLLYCIHYSLTNITKMCF